MNTPQHWPHIKKKLMLVIVSDGTGETASAMCRAAMAQFSGKDVYFTRYKNIRTKEQLDAIFNQATIQHDMIAYTIVSPELRSYMTQLAKEKHVRIVDLMGHVLTAFSNFFEAGPNYTPGALHAVNDEYFQRVGAMEFTLNHDDGKNSDTLHLADVVLLGISRTSKTPLSIYLSLQGLKTANIPLVPGTTLPPQLFSIDQKKIFCLTINVDTLWKIRKNRLEKLGASQHPGDYADIKKIMNEVQWAGELFDDNKRWPVLDVSGKAIEETASEIIKLLQMRKGNQFLKEKSSHS